MWIENEAGEGSGGVCWLWRDSRERLLKLLGAIRKLGKGNNRTAARESPRTDGMLYSHVDMNLNARREYYCIILLLFLFLRAPQGTEPYVALSVQFILIVV